MFDYILICREILLCFDYPTFLIIDNVDKQSKNKVNKMTIFGVVTLGLLPQGNPSHGFRIRNPSPAQKPPQDLPRVYESDLRAEVALAELEGNGRMLRLGRLCDGVDCLRVRAGDGQACRYCGVMDHCAILTQDNAMQYYTIE